MKTVLIVRHAKSSMDINGFPDLKRPLTEKGKKKIKKVIDYLLERNIRVDYILSSHAVRAIETAKILAHALKYPEEDIKSDPQLYFSDSKGILNQFYDLPDRFKSIMIIGHNPALSEFVNRFLSEPIDHLPTSGIVSISFLTENWDEVPKADYEINFVLFPKEMKKKAEPEIRHFSTKSHSLVNSHNLPIPLH
jgi:phosphohistidine phosphatase